MRITNSMLVSNFLHDLNNNLSRISKLQTQMATGRKFANISDDPISTMYSMQARFRLDNLARYQESVKMAKSWLTQAETGVFDLNEVYKSAYETVIDAATDVKTEADRRIMAEYIGQLRDHVLQTLNSTFGNKYIFSGFNTTGSYPGSELEPPYSVDKATGDLWLNGLNLTRYVPNYDPAYDLSLKPGDAGYDAVKEKASMSVLLLAEKFAQKTTDGYDPAYNIDLPPEVDDFDQAKLDAYNAYIAARDLYIADYNADFAANGAEYQALFEKLEGEQIEFWVGTGIKMDAVLNGIGLVGTGPENLYSMLDNLYNDLINGQTVPNIQKSYITQLQNMQSGLLAKSAELGGRMNRLDMLSNRYEMDFINYTQLKSDAEDADLAELIMNFSMAMNVYNAALSSGAMVIQKTLVDFIR
ncbi:MAG: flagellar hook-associated protein FlgL [Clostridiales bacterium]|nr:flagellar hook-associated protein FlgL [Clostridiales bacterium]